MLVNIKAIAHRVTDDELLQLSSDNPDTKFETTKEGKLIIMSPTEGSTGKKNSSLLAQVWVWNNRTQKGEVFDSSTGFRLANGSVRSPDVSWIKLSRWNQLTQEQQAKFVPIDPDFKREIRGTWVRLKNRAVVIELRSSTDKLDTLQQKMQEYMDCGVKLGWLINPQDKQVEIYLQKQNKEILNAPIILSGEAILPGLTIDLKNII